MTPLTVEVDPTNPNRVNLTGDGFAFLATLSGNRVYITGVDRAVTATFADPQADIQWSGGVVMTIPSYFIRSTNDGTYYPILPSWTTGVTLGEVSNNDDFALYAKYDLAGFWDGLSDIGTYGSKLYITFGLLDIPQVWRINLNGAETEWDDVFEVGNNSNNTYGVRTCVYDESTIYCVYYNDFNYDGTTGGELFIAKYVDGELVSETKIWNEYEQWNSTWLYWSDIYWITRQKYGDEDVLVINFGFDSDFASGTFILGFVSYDLVTDTILNKEFIAQTDDIDNISANYPFVWYWPPPSGYKYYVICTTGIDATDRDEENGTQACGHPSFLVDIRNGNVTRLDGILEDNLFGDEIVIGAGLDKSTGIYYFTMYEHGQSWDGETYTEGDGWVGKVDLNAVFPAESTVGLFVNGTESGFGILQGDGSVYIDDWNATPTRILKNLPIFSQAEDISRPDWYGNVIIDSDQSRAYQCDYTDPTSLTGFNISGVGSIGINLIDIDDYVYPDDVFKKTVLIGLYNNMAFVLVSSSEVGQPDQRDFYIFGPQAGSGSASVSPSPSIGSESASESPSISPSISGSASFSPSASISQSASISPSPSAGSASLSPSASISFSASLSPSRSGSASLSPSASISPSLSQSPSPSKSASVSPSPENGKRITNIGANVEYKNTDNYKRITNIGAHVEYKDTTNYKRITAIGIMVEYHDVPSPSVSPSPSASPST